MSLLTYRGGEIRRCGGAWGWRVGVGMYGWEIDCGYPPMSPTCVVRWAVLGWRIRSDEEALRILCEAVDEYWDKCDRAARLVKERQEELSAREAIMRDLA